MSSSRSSPPWPARPGACSAARPCSSTSGGTPSTATRAPSTSTSATCGKSSSRTRKTQSSSSPCAGWATASGSNGMRRFRPTALGNRITVTAVAIAAGTVLIVYAYVAGIGGAASGLSSVKTQILIGGLIAVAVALLIGIYFAGLASGSISRLQEAARKVADGNFETPIPISSTGQLGSLARTFNEMQRRLAELDSARKQFIANASHELRTPIFSLGGFVELLEEEDDLSPAEREEFVRTMRGQIERLTKLTHDLLDLSQLDAGAMVMVPDGVDLGEL